jgi:signal peptidase I
MTSTMNDARVDPVRAFARAVLAAAVRGRRDRGGPWGEAVLAEFSQTTGRWEAVRWAAGGLRAVWHERRARAKTRPRYVRISRRIVFSTIAALIASFLVTQFVLTPRFMVSGSMEPTVLITDRYLLDRVGFHVTGLKYGDMVEVRVPGEPKATTLKRIIGLPGDVIDCSDGRVFRNTVQLKEPYVNPGDRTECTSLTVPPSSIYLLGDHRIVSQDSREWGAVPDDAVVGRYVVRVWPVDGRMDVS